MAASSKAPLSIRCRPGPAPAISPCFSGKPAIPCRRGSLQGDLPALPADALAQLPPEQIVKHVSTADWGRLQEARVVGKQKALETYEDIVRGRIDPALLEYAGGNTFRGRVFPIPAKGYNRVLIAYEELLPVSQQQAMYRFPLPDCKLTELNFTLNARTDECRDVAFKPADAKKEEGGSQLAYTKTWTEKGPGGEVLFRFTPPRPALQAISGRHGDSGPLYAYARIRPEIKAEAAKPFAKHAVFLLDTSLERASRPLRRQHEAAEANPGKRPGHRAVQRPGLQRRRRLARAEGWLANTQGRPRNGPEQARRHRARRGHRPQRGPRPSWLARGWPPTRRWKCSCFPTARSPGARPMSPRWWRGSRRTARIAPASIAIAPAWVPTTRSCSRR